MKKKKYCFDYIKEDVMKWAPEVRKNVTKQMLYMLPLRVIFPFIMPDRITPAMDYYGEVIDDYDVWNKQREEYIDNLYNKLKGNDKNKNLKEIDVNIEKVIENVKELLEECHKKLIEITMIPKNRFK